MLLLAVQARGQRVAADCTILFTLTSAGQSSVSYNNIQTGCSIWSFVVATNGFSAATVALQSAPDTGGTPSGTWVTYLNQTLLFGVNPFVGASTGAAAGAWVEGYNPWVRVSLTSATGTGQVIGAAYGYKKILR